MFKQNNKLWEIAKLFFKLGCIGFWGPSVHIAMMEKEVVQKKKWMSQEHFLDLVSATNLIPGPNSTEMTMHCGHERAGWKGLIIAGLCFILPAVSITAVFAWAYSKYGTLPEVSPFLYGIKPAIIAVILSAMYSMGKKAFKTTGALLDQFIQLKLPKLFIYGEHNSKLSYIPTLWKHNVLTQEVSGSDHFIFYDNPKELYETIGVFINELDT